MVKSLVHFIALAILSKYTMAEAVAPLDPMITAAPVFEFKRQASSNFIGWYPQGVVGNTTSWGSYTCASSYTFTSAGGYFKCCPSGVQCNLYTACSGNYLINGVTSVNCATVITTGGPGFCSSDVLFPTPNAIDGGESYIWCGSTGDTGTIVFRSTAAATTNTRSTTPTTRTGTSVTGGQGDTTTGTSTRTNSPTSSPSSGGSKTPIGAIVGGVVGGIAVIAIAAALIFWLVWRNKNRQAANGTLGEKNVGAGAANGGAGNANYAPNGSYPPSNYPSSTVPNYGPAAPHYGPTGGQTGGHGGAMAGGAAAAAAVGAGYLAANHHNSGQHHDPNYNSYYGSDGKPISAQYAGAGSNSPAPVYNAHDSMYKAPIAAGGVPVPGSPNAPTANAYEMESGSNYPQTSPAISSAHPSNASPAPHHANVAELPTPAQSPAPHNAQVIHEAPSDSIQSPPQSDLSPPPANAHHTGFQSGPVPEWQH